jgi:thiamine-phosphate pyrophosphorylase
MSYLFTPAAQRALGEAAIWRQSAETTDETAAILLGLLAEAECRAAAMLRSRSISQQAIFARWPDLQRTTDRLETDIPPPRLAAVTRTILRGVEQLLFDFPRPLTIATEHLLLGILAGDSPAGGWLREQGLSPELVCQEIRRLYGLELASETSLEMEPEPLANDLARSDEELNEDGPIAGSVEPAAVDTEVLRVLDAAANRAREGLRVVEDYVRFVLDDRHLTWQLKTLRHDLSKSLAFLVSDELCAARDTISDVGTELTTTEESRRTDLADGATANMKRAQEALRSLEEYGKLVSPALAKTVKQLRYRSYTLERAIAIMAASLQALEAARLYVLVDGCSTPDEFERLISALVEAGTHVIQLRDKRLSDRQLLQRARLLQRLTTGSRTLCIINDRPDIARLCRADGVHLGQDEFSVKDARSIIGTRALVGISTHSIEQARAAVLAGANYLGVGPTFPSSTKQFDAFTGTELLRTVADEIQLPAFAIGGITLENLSEVLATGIGRVAVRGAITAAGEPGRVAREFLTRLEEARSSRGRGFC